MPQCHGCGYDVLFWMEMSEELNKVNDIVKTKIKEWKEKIRTTLNHPPSPPPSSPPPGGPTIEEVD